MEIFIIIIILFILLAVVVVIAIIAKKNYKYPKTEVEKKQVLFYLRDDIMNKSERIFFDILKRELGDTYNIFSKIRVEDFVGVKKIGVSKKEFGLRNRIKSRHVDFLLCDKSMKPVMAIEIDGSSHRSEKAIKRDNFINTLYEDIKLPIKHIRVGSKFIDEVENIKQELSESSVERL